MFSNPEGGLGWSWYREHPIDIIAFWNGGFRGLGIFGAILVPAALAGVDTYALP